MQNGFIASITRVFSWVGVIGVPGLR